MSAFKVVAWSFVFVIGALLVYQDQAGSAGIEGLGPWFLLFVAVLPIALVVLVLWLLLRR